MEEENNYHSTFSQEESPCGWGRRS